MFRAPTLQDLLDSKTSSAMPSEEILPSTRTRNYFQAIDNLNKVFAIRPTDNGLPPEKWSSLMYGLKALRRNANGQEKS